MLMLLRLLAVWRCTLAVSCAAIGMTVITSPIMVMFLRLRAARHGTLAIGNVAA